MFFAFACFARNLFTSACIPTSLYLRTVHSVLIPYYGFQKVALGVDAHQYMLPNDIADHSTGVYLSHPGQQCRTSCTNTSHSVQKSFEQSVHRYRPRGLIPSAPVSIVAPVVPLVEFGSEFPFVAEVAPLAPPATEFLLPGPESVACWNILEHA